MTLSPDGKYLAYTLTPAEGDGAVVVRHVASGAEHRIPTGRRSAEGGDGPAPNPEPAVEQEAEWDQAPPAGPPTPSAGPPVGGPAFTPDSRRVLFSLLPTKAEAGKAKADKVAPADTPRGVVVIAELEPWKITERVERVRSFAVVGDGAGVLVYRKEPKAAEAPKKDTPPEPQAGPSRFGRSGAGGPPRGDPRPAAGSADRFGRPRLGRRD
jgi:hypothetical protein